MIKLAKFVSIWDNDYEIITNCKVDLSTKEVFNIEISKDVENLEHLEKEFVIIDDEKHEVFNKDLYDVDTSINFWYN